MVLQTKKKMTMMMSRSSFDDSLLGTCEEFGHTCRLQ